MTDLVDRLRSALDHAEAAARAATPGPWSAEPNASIVAPTRLVVASAVAAERWPSDPDSAFIAANDPAHVLRSIAAHRRIVDRCADILSTASPYFTVESCDETDAILAEQVVRDLASIYLPDTDQGEPR